MSSPPGYAVGPPIGKDMAVAENTRRTDSYLYEAEREEKVPQAKSDRAGTAGEAERGEVGGAAGSLVRSNASSARAHAADSARKRRRE